MEISTSVRLAALSLSLASTAAVAEWRCDCTTIVDNCSASVTVRDSWVDVTSSHAQCARVDYFIDGAPFVALVVGGETRQDWLARSNDPDILIQSCQVCLDRSDEMAATAAPATEDGELTAAIQVTPEYPAAAATQGTEGFVEVSFTVTPFGEIQAPQVMAAEPAGVFDQAAMAALSRWRYPADAGREPVTLSHRFDFALDAALMALAPAAVEPATARQTASERNQCVREQASYDYGEMIEVSLMNACADPIVVFSCAEGTGRLSRQWVCVSSERGQEALVRPGDSRIGELTAVASPAGRRDYRYSPQLYVARAPNSQYWWLACQMNDEECRANGRQWVRSIDRQLASIDPRNRTARPLARAN